MNSGFRRNDGADFDAIFDPDVIGDGPSVGGFRRADGSALRYAHIKYGSKGPNVGFRNNDGNDVSNLWAAKGTAVYAMPVNGNTYQSNNQNRGTACVRFNIYSNGTFDVQDWRSTTQQTVLASGTWLPQGDAVGDWTVQISAVTRNEGTVQGGTTGAETNASSQQSCSSDHFGRTYAFSASTVQRANCDGTIVVQLYKNGQLRSTTTIYTYQNVNGN